MTTTARRRDPDDDIAAIAKQISDQAEAIYQNWKSRGLAPAELISCHAAGDTTKLGSLLKPQPPAKPPSIELLAQAPTMDNNRLEKLVKSFVDEDKARIATARNKTMPSSIQYALQKFESKGNGEQTTRDRALGRKTTTLPVRKPAAYGSTPQPEYSTPNSVQQIQPVKPAIAQKPQISPKPRLGDTIEMTLPIDTPTSGLQTWPLKNRLISTDNVKKTAGTEVDNHQPSPNQFQPQYRSGLKLATNIANIDHQIALEEKKLINALKNGDVVKEEPRSLSIGRRDPLGDLSVIPSIKPHSPALISNSSLSKDFSSTSLVTKTMSNSSLPKDSTSNLAHTADPPTAIVTPLTTKWGLRATSRRPISEQQVPHPELTTSQRQHLRQAQAQANPVRPFLTRGSVAERVLIFERCPSDLLLDKRGRAPSIGYVSKPQPLQKQPSLQHTTLQRHVRAHRNVNIPRFHFPVGKPGSQDQMEVIRTKIVEIFTKIGETASRGHFGQIVQACQLPLYWKTPLYLAACSDTGGCTLDQLMTFYQTMSSQCHDAASRFVYILTRGRRVWLAPEDFIPLVQDVVETHPGLTFLKEATEFHSRYVHTVIARIYYCVNRSWSGKITIPEIRRSNLLSIVQLLEEEEDINQITQYFSYEHFYVIYCKFWELDRDHDLFIDKQDLTRHNDHALSSRIIDRIFSGCVTRGHKNRQEERMSYTDFVWFLLSEEDKLHPTAIEYWFRCMDLDGDGYLSMYELEYFYEEQMHRMDAIGIETLPFQDCLCQMLDMVKPKTPGKVALSDLKKCRMTSIFFDTFFNLEKYLDHEQRDPFASQRDHDIDGQEMSDWDRYAAEEYELLVAEEGGNDQNDSLSCEEANDEDLLSQHLDGVLDDEGDQAELSEDSDDCSI